MKQVSKEQWRDSGKRGSGKKNNMHLGVESGQACYVWWKVKKAGLRGLTEENKIRKVALSVETEEESISGSLYL